MTDERENPQDNYLNAQLREELGPPVDLSQRVLQAWYSDPANAAPARPRSRLLPMPRRTPRWKPVAAAAAILLSCGLAVYSLVSSGLLEPKPALRGTAESPKTSPAPDTPRAPERKLPAPVRDDQPETPQPEAQQPEAPQPETPQSAPDAPAPDALPGITTEPGTNPAPEPEPEPTAPYPEIKRPIPDDKTDPPGAFPDPQREPTAAGTSAVVGRIVANPRDVRLTRDGRQFERLPADASVTGFVLHAGDKLRVLEAAPLTLSTGALLTLEGEFTLGHANDAPSLAMHSGAFYADTTGAAALPVQFGLLACTIDGVACMKESGGRMRVFCLEGTVRGPDRELKAGFSARLYEEEFGREAATSWSLVQREMRFLKTPPTRVMWREDFNETPGEIWGGEVVDGVLRGKLGPADQPERGTAFYFRENYTVREGDVLRFRVKFASACDVVVQINSEVDGNYRHKLAKVKAGEWLTIEIPLSEFFKTADPGQLLQPGMLIRRFQLHPEDHPPIELELDQVEFIHRPS